MEAYLTPGASGWHTADLSFLTGGEPGLAGVPFGWIRADNVNSVIYLGTDGNLYETSLRLGGSWSTVNLTDAELWPIPANEPASEPTAYVRSDGVSAILFRGPDNHIYEMSLKAGGNWITTDLMYWAGAVNAASDPHGYVRSDGVNAVVYADSNGNIWELSLVNEVWTRNMISLGLSAPPIDLTFNALSTYVRADRANAVVFTSADQHVWELSLPTNDGGPTPWGAKDLTQDSAN